MRNKALLVGLFLLGYVGSYAALWSAREDTILVRTDHGCIKRTREVPALRSAWLERGPLRGFVTAVYWPVNAFLLSRANEF